MHKEGSCIITLIFREVIKMDEFIDYILVHKRTWTSLLIKGVHELNSNVERASNL